MINAQRTGAYISGRRKAQDWTQQDLAQRLQITHQAVSQWEKGAAFPDVALLPQLARTLGVSVDDLLNGGPLPPTRGVTRGAIVEELARGAPGAVADLVRNHPEGVDRMLEAAPLAKPSQMNAVVAHLAGFSFTLEQLISLAPFVSQDALEAALTAARLEPVAGARLADLAPHLGQRALDQWVQHIAPGTLTIHELKKLAPFLGSDTLNALVRDRLSGEAPVAPEHLAGLAPFLGEAGVSELLRRLPAGPLPLDYIRQLAPFTSSTDLERLIAQQPDPASLSDYLHELAPFLAPAHLKRLLLQVKDRLSAQTLVELAPFLDQETLDEIFRQGLGPARRPAE